MARKTLTIGGGIIAVAALIAIITNPNLTDFKAQRDAEDGVTGLTCKSVQTDNYVVFSRYEYRCMMSTTKYVGAFGNYYALKDDAKQA
jgi:hypothetical protein